jgi:hypothetical protein
MNIRRILVATDFSEGARAAASGPRGESRGKTTRPVLAVERWPEDACRRVLVPVDFVMCW